MTNIRRYGPNYGYNLTDGGMTGPQLCGQDHPLSKLTNEQVIEMIELAKTGQYSSKRLALLYGVAQGTIRQIIRGDTWNTIINTSDTKIVLPVDKQEEHPNALLSKEEVRSIMVLYNDHNYSRSGLAQLFDVSHGTINDIITGFTWSQITGIDYNTYVHQNRPVKLTSEIAIHIAQLYNQDGYSYGDIMKIYDVSMGNISDILGGRAWSKATSITSRLTTTRKLCKETVLEIVALGEAGTHTHKQIATQFNIAPSYVSHILIGRAWASITGISPDDHQPKLTAEKVEQIVTLYATNNYTQQELAQQFGVSKSAVKNILGGRTWSSITGIQRKPKA